MKLIRNGLLKPSVIFLLLVFSEVGFAQNTGRQVPSLLPRKTSSPSPNANPGIDEESLQSFVRRFKRDVLEDESQNQIGESGQNQGQSQYSDQYPTQYRSVGYPNSNSGLRQVNPSRESFRSVQDFDPSPEPPQDDNSSGANQDPTPGFNPFDVPDGLFNQDFEPGKKDSVLEPKTVIPDDGQIPQARQSLPRQSQPRQSLPTQPRTTPRVEVPDKSQKNDSVILPDSRFSPKETDSPQYYIPEQMDYLPNFRFHPESGGVQQAPNPSQTQTPQYQGAPRYPASPAFGADGSYIPAPGHQHYGSESATDPHSAQYGNQPQDQNVGGNGGYFGGGRQNYSGIAGQEFLITEDHGCNDFGFECELPIFYLSAFGYGTDLKNLASSSTTLHTVSGGGFGFAIGQRQGENLRMELEYSFRTNDVNGATSQTGFRDLTGKVKSQAGMANVYWEMVNFPTRRLKPYFGAGLGFARLDSEIFDSLALPVALGRLKDSSFAHQYIAGVNYKGFRNMDLFIEYRLFNADPFQIQNAGVDKYDYETTNLGGGLRWKF